jgi:alanine racemase
MDTPTLTVSLPAIKANYRLLQGRHAKKNIAAVVKANAYGLGVEAVSNAFWQEDCREFFVATLEEAIELRAALPEAQIGVFNGLLTGKEKDYAAHKLMPVLNTPEQIKQWQKIKNPATQSIIHVDTGMTRLGLQASDLAACASSSPALLISHLACANDPAHPKNAEQLARFKQALTLFPGAKASLCNSSGVFLPPEFHFDVARPGCALYGINPTNGKNPMQPVATLSAPILQIRSAEQDETVGYGATYNAKRGSRLAIIALGYADGWTRMLSNKGFGFVSGHKVPVAGRISMDMLALDVTEIPESKLASSVYAEFINKEQTVDDIAQACGTIGYEVFTRIGSRVKRIYANS